MDDLPLIVWGAAVRTTGGTSGTSGAPPATAKAAQDTQAANAKATAPHQQQRDQALKAAAEIRTLDAWIPTLKNK